MFDEEIIDLAKSLNSSERYTAIVDFSRPADQHRFFLISTGNWTIDYSSFTSHGSGSGPRTDAREFGNIANSLKSSKGIMKTGKTYYGKHGYSRKLIGLEEGINDQVFNRAIVLHPADYVSPSHVRTHGYPGRSWGCITLDPKKSEDIINLLQEGSLVYVHTK